MRKLTLLVGAAPVGLLTGILAWFIAGGPTASATQLDPIETEISNMRPPPAGAAHGSYVNIQELTAAPLFALTTGPNAIKLPSVRVDGVSLSKTRTAALVSIAGKPSEWLSVNDEREGVKIKAITREGISFTTLAGAQDVAIGAQVGGGDQAPTSTTAAPSPTQQAAIDQIPAGFHSPPPPASAPQSK